MKTLLQNAFDDFENKQIIWEFYGELLDTYDQSIFCAKQLAYELNMEVKLVNKILHRLIQHKAITCTGADHWGIKQYRLNNAFKGY